MGVNVIGYSRLVEVDSVTKFVDIRSGIAYYEYKLSKFDNDMTVGTEMIVVSRQKLFKKGQKLVVTVSKRKC